MVHNISSLIAVRLDSEPELSEGTTNPIKLECVPIDGLNNPKTYVVKFGKSVAGGEMGIASEIIAGYLANHFKIPVPEFCLVEITEAFAKSVHKIEGISDRILSTINQNIGGYNFGSKVINNTRSVLHEEKYTPDQIEMASRIFAFDALIYNADRTRKAPNIFSVENSFIIFDHEKSFNFISRNPIEISEDLDFRSPNGDSFMHDHIFFQSLKDYDNNFSNFIEMLEGLENAIISESIGQLPYIIRNEFKEKITTIETHLKFVRESTNIFRFNLMKVLA